MSKNYDQWEIEVFYESGDSENVYSKRERLPLFWRDKELAKKALNEIVMLKKIGDLYGLMYEDFKDSHPFLLGMPDGKIHPFQIALELDSGERKVIATFWNEDNFNFLKSLKVVRETFKEEGDEVIF